MKEIKVISHERDIRLMVVYPRDGNSAYSPPEVD